MNSERLLTLAQHLETVPEEKFDLATWVGYNPPPGDERHGTEHTEYVPNSALDLFAELDEDGRITGYKRGTCNTSACAIGHAGAIKAFRDAGFYLQGESYYHYHEWSFVPVYETDDLIYQNWDAVAEFFGISSDTAHHLFMAEHYKGKATPRDVAARIRELVAGGE